MDHSLSDRGPLDEAHESASRRIAVGLVALAIGGVNAAVALVALFYAWIFSGGNEQFPEGPELVPWFAVPIVGCLAAGYACRSAYEYLVHRRHGGRFLIAIAAALASYVLVWEMFAAFAD